MTDYKNLKLIATSSPHIRAAETTRSIMLDVIIAMVPALVWAVITFGVEALLLTAVSVVGCVFWEWQAHEDPPVCGRPLCCGHRHAAGFRVPPLHPAVDDPHW